MDIKKINEIISKVKVPFTDASFYPRLYNLILKETKLKSDDEFRALCEEEYGDISRRADLTKIQESSSLRNVLRSRAFANFLINDKGEIYTDLLSSQIETFKKTLYSLGPNRQYDSVRQELILKVLQSLVDDREIQTLLKTVSKPYLNKDAEEIIRNTLNLSQNQTITESHTKKAVLSAYICYLRQSVGSCFGTAPAIVIHNEQPKTFLRDIVELLGTSRLKRTYGGVEYSVPLSSNWGIGDLKKQFIFSDDLNVEKNNIWYSPGLINALDAVSIFPENFKLKDKVEKAKELCLAAFSQLKDKSNYLVINMEELLRAILLNQYQLKEEDIIAYQAKERLLSKGSLLISTPQNTVTTNISSHVPKFLNQLELAKTAFKILVDNALLKSWEFTISSFSENKAGFTNWNLYASLGFKANESHGIGETIYEMLKEKLDESNRKVHDFQNEYEQAFSHVKYLETRMRTTSTENELKYLKIEYQSRVHDFHFLEEMRDKLHAKAKRLASLFDLLVDIFMYLFPQYFQEVYDAGMQDIAASQYDDSPAGFRLLFKHGRGNTAQWTRIYTADEFIDSLVAFFTSTESEIRNSADMEGLEDEFSQIITAVVLKIRTGEFLESAFSRMAAAHHTVMVKDPLNNLDKIDKKPWAYVSGGSMSTLVTTYYKREQKPNEVARWVENPVELLVFLVDSMKQLPQKLKDEYANDQNKSMLIHSPTHAFTLKPGFNEFKMAWQSEVFTYTYIRDQLLAPRERFIRQIILDEEMMEFCINELLESLPINFENYIKSSLKSIYKTLSPIEFRNHLVDQLKRDKSLTYTGRSLFTKDDIDSKLYSLLPLFPAYQLKELVTNVLKELPNGNVLNPKLLNEILDSIYDTVKDVKILSANRLQDICKSVIILMNLNTTFPIDYHLEIAKVCQDLGYALQAPIIVADSNWVKDYFGFVVNPGTGDFEFWRVDATGTLCAPMSNWDQWLNGSRRDLTWGIFNRPYEYSF